MNYLKVLIVISSLLLSALTIADDVKPKNGTTGVTPKANVTDKPEPEHPKVIVKDSALCKKCDCVLETKFLDCTNRSMTEWFSTEEWDVIKYGDVQFETIKLSNNNLTKVPALPRIAVKKLYLDFNKIVSIENKAFKNLWLIESLDLSYNLLTTKALVPEIFEGPYSPTEYEPLANFKELNLAHNELHTLYRDVFEHLPHLETLILSSNTFHVIDQGTESALTDLHCLKTLDMSYMELSELPDPIFHAPRELETLILTGNLFDELPNDALGYALNLVSLNIDENPIKEFGADEDPFPKLPRLRFISMSYMPVLEYVGAGAFSNLQNLRELQLTNNPKLSQLHAKAFAKSRVNDTYVDYPPIEKLYLHNNNLTILDRDLLERWDKVTTIDLRHNPWRCDCENNWLIHSLFSQIKANNEVLTADVTCGSPEPWKGVPLSDLHEKKKVLRCADTEGNHPENDGGVLVGMLIGLLVGIPLTFIFIIVYRRGCFGLLGRYGPQDGGRALYNRAQFQDDYHI